MRRSRSEWSAIVGEFERGHESHAEFCARRRLNVGSFRGVWKNTTVDLTGFAGQDIVVYYGDHDDDGPGDPTYMLIDDVTVTNQ